MTCRDEVLKTMKTLSRGSNNDAFALKVIIDQVLSQTKAYKESTIRTHITSKLCANAPVNHAMVYKDLFRVDVGYYRLNNGGTDLEGTNRSEVRHTKPTGLSFTPAVHGQEQHVSVKDLKSIDLHSSLIILTCSLTKRSGGESNSESDPLTWPTKLLDARANVRELAKIKDDLVMPAWLRNNGFFYQPAASSLKEAVSQGAHIVIISGGYGIVRAEEYIGDYDMKMSCSDWPDRVLEETLIHEAIRVGAKNVVAFASRSSDYATVIKGTRWSDAGIERALLVTHEPPVRVGQREILEDLGRAFSGFWNEQFATIPANVKVKALK